MKINNVKISIIIPTYEANGFGHIYIKECLNSIRTQTYKNYEVIVSDHSVNDDIKKSILEYSDLDIKHFFNDIGRGSITKNMNCGIKKATGDIIKIMHYDDKFCDNNALQYLADLFSKKETYWGLFGFNHYYQSNNSIDWVIIPHRTKWGCPSVSFFINDANYPNIFDENVLIMNDHDMHCSLLKKYGDPEIISNICVTVRLHENQASNFKDNTSKITQDRDYIRSKYPEFRDIT